ncbi:MAG TPA: ECF transporter S component [Candidatus Scatomorpha merdipullorum]|uniref:ECF transporter S component n=1 Tax=Candidatus Scatomorpha merdipullorum TaxID=2840927 RepID=A0A9D1FE36_9FIRM|nr:ECF transporter S component [Candidatus Scatomorpha merdipullorum]
MDAVKKSARMDTKKLATLAMLTALAYVVMYLSKLMPSVNGFLDFDFKDVVLCIGGFVYGPIAALMMIVIVCVLEMVTVSHTDIIGCIMNIVATASFVCTACAIYKRKHTMKGAIVGLASAVVVLVVVMLAWNYFLTPIYQKIPREAVAAMLPTVFLPFNAVKGGLNMTATLLVYKPVVDALRRAKLIPESTSQAAPVQGKKHLGMTLVILFVFVSCVLFALSLQGII